MKSYIPLTLLSASLFAIFALTVSSDFSARAKDVDKCPKDGPWIKDEDNPFTVTREGFVLTGVCVKGGLDLIYYNADTWGDACWNTAGYGTQTGSAEKVGIEGSDCKDISHVSFRFENGQNNEPSPTPSDTPGDTPENSPTPTDTVTESPTPTDTPEQTATPTPTPFCEEGDEDCIYIHCPGEGECVVTIGSPSPSPTGTPGETQTPTQTSTPTPTTEDTRDSGSSSSEDAGGTGGGDVATTGDVLGVSTLAQTGIIMEYVSNFFFLAGTALVGVAASLKLQRR